MMLTLLTLTTSTSVMIGWEQVQGGVIHTADGVPVTLAFLAGVRIQLVALSERFVVVEGLTCLAAITFSVTVRVTGAHIGSTCLVTLIGVTMTVTSAGIKIANIYDNCSQDKNIKPWKRKYRTITFLCPNTCTSDVISVLILMPHLYYSN